MGAQTAYPNRLTMLAGGPATAAKHDLPIRAVVIKNNTLDQIKRRRQTWSRPTSTHTSGPKHEFAMDGMRRHRAS